MTRKKQIQQIDSKMNMVCRSPACEMFLLLLCLTASFANTKGNNPVNQESIEPITLNLIGLPKRGTYVVKEDIEKAPVHDHPCNLTETVVKISFPEMKSEVFINLLGYKGSNMIYLKRCKGRCMDSDSPVSCTATRIREKKVKMTVRSFLTGGKPRERLKELILDDHMECGCECAPGLSSECAGMFNVVTCECECPASEFGEKKVVCEMRRDHYWDSRRCKCASKTVAPRGVDLGCNLDLNNPALVGRQLDRILASSDNRKVNMIAWVLLGASFTAVSVLATLTWHYRRKSIRVKKKSIETTGTFETSIDRLQEDPDFKGRYVDNSVSIGSKHSCEDFKPQPISMPRQSKKYKSCENLLQGMPSTQYVEIGGEVFFQPYRQHGLGLHIDHEQLS